MTIQNSTLKYYEAHADAFVEGTVNVDFHATQNKFLSLLPKNAAILDFGCGSGRDTKYFLERGYEVTAIDGSEKLCALASQYTGIDVKNMLFQELDMAEAFDGIWACASILHLPYDELVEVMGKLQSAVRHGGVIYTSFKHGCFRGERHGRYFTDMDEDCLKLLVQQFDELALQELWITGDVRPDRGEEKWLNVLLSRL